MANMTTSIIMELVDRVTRPVRRIQQTLSGLGRRAGLDRLAGAARRVGSAMGGVVGQARALGERFLVMGGLAAGAVWGVERLVSGVTDVGTAVQESAERLGVGTTWLQEWQFAGRQFGVQNDALVDGLKELGLRADEFVMTAGGPAAEAFGRLGIGIDELRKTGGRTEALFDLVRDRLGRVQNMAARQRIFDEIFGGQGGEQMVAMLGATREELDALIRLGRENGGILDEEAIEQSREYNREMGNLRQSLFGIQTTVVGELLPAIVEWIERMRELASANREAISERILEGIRSFWSGLQQVGRVVSWLADEVGGFGNLMLWLAGVMSISLLGSIATAGLAIINFGILLATTPVGWFLAAVVAIAGAAYLIYRNWDGIVAWFGDLWEGIQAWFGQGIGGIMRDLASWSPAGLVVRAIDGIFEAFGARPMSEMVAEWFSGVRERVTQLWDRIQAWFGQGIGAVTRDILSFSPAGLLLRAIDEVFELFGARPLSDIAAEWIGTLVDGVAGAWEALPTWVEGRFEALRGIFAGFSLGDIGRAWIDSLRAGIAEEWNGLTNWLSGKIEGLTAWLPDWVKDGLGIEATPQPTGTPALGAPAGGDRQAPLPAQARVDVGGELRVVVDSEGRPRVAEARRNGGMDFNVESGMLGVMP